MGWTPDDIVIGYVSRMAAEKNVDYLADALEIVAARRPDARILMVGDGPSRASLEGRLGSVARFVGYRKGEDLANHYAASDLFAFPSRTRPSETRPRGHLLGSARRRIAPGGVGEIVQSGTTGILVEPTEPPERMAEALVSLIDRPGERLRMAEAACRYAQSQSWSMIMGGLRDRYLRLIEAPSTTVVAEHMGR